MALASDVRTEALLLSSSLLLKTSPAASSCSIYNSYLRTAPSSASPSSQLLHKVHAVEQVRLRGRSRAPIHTPWMSSGGSTPAGYVEIDPSCSDAASVLSQRWMELVAAGRIASESNFEGRRLRYGLRMNSAGGIEEFVEDVENVGGGNMANCRSLYKEDGGVMIKLVSSRRLRPPAAFNRSQQRRVLPPHDSSCSLCFGPISLPLREKAAVVVLPTECEERRWDFHYNIAPIEARGHFLVVPDMGKEENCREQKLILTDCMDMAAMSKQLRGICLNFNSPNAGATQNHIHLHAWKQDYVYSVEQAGEREGEWDFGGVSVRELEYPAFCVRISNDKSSSHVGKVVHRILEAAGEDSELSWNVVFSNGNVYIFLRTSEVAQQSLPGFAFGCNQMMGFWNVDTEDQFELVDHKTASLALRETSVGSLRGRSVISRAREGFVGD
uniref:GDP-D-glucose phosphorylase n=1 Tax=Hanusia phi TaxID=3032 RepID=A0A7S0F348_9CRYP